jgi:hypothetical protein
MKKILLILSIILTLSSCVQEIIEPITPVPTIKSIFDMKESVVVDGQTIQFDLPTDGIYILTYMDVETGQVISREKFNGKVGKNLKKVYTKTIITKYLYLILSSENRIEISKTKLIIN